MILLVSFEQGFEQAVQSFEQGFEQTFDTLSINVCANFDLSQKIWDIFVIKVQFL